MGNMLDRKDEDIVITRKLANGASMSVNSPMGAQTDLTGLMRNLMNQGGESSFSMDRGPEATVKDVKKRIKEAIEAGTDMRKVQQVVEEYAKSAEDEDEAEMVVRATIKMIKQMRPQQSKIQPPATQYRQFGGNIGLQGPYAAQAQQLQQAADLQSQGALSSSALAASGSQAADRAGLIGQAGLQNQSFTPQFQARGQVGQGVLASREAQAGAAKGRAGLLGQQYAEQTRKAERAEDQARADRIRKEDLDRAQKIKDDKEAESVKKDIRALKNIAEDMVSTMEAVDASVGAWEVYRQAVTYANRLGYAATLAGAQDRSVSNAVDREVKNYMRSAVEKGGIKGLISGAGDKLSNLVSALGFSSVDDIEEKPLLTQDEYQGWLEVYQRIRRLAQKILDTQTGTKTDFDAQNAADQVADLSGNAASIKHNLQVALNDVNRSLRQLEAAEVQYMEQKQEKAGGAADPFNPLTSFASPQSRSGFSTVPKKSLTETGSDLASGALDALGGLNIDFGSWRD